jgi:hypothetical protein
MREAVLVSFLLVALIVGSAWYLNQGDNGVRVPPGVAATIGPVSTRVGPAETSGLRKGAEMSGGHASGMNGVNLMSPADGAFDGLAASLAPGWEKTLAKAKPFMAIISNSSHRRVVAFAVQFKWEEEPLTTNRVQFRDPDALAGVSERLRDDPNERELSPGESRLFGMSFALAPHKPEYETVMQPFIDQLSREHKGFGLPTIAIDALIFDDGEVVGVDGSELREHYSVAVEMKQAVYRKIIDAVTSGMSFEAAFGEAEKEMIARRGALREDLKLYTDEAMADVRNSKTKQGVERTLAVIKKLLLEKTVEIRKAP